MSPTASRTIAPARHGGASRRLLALLATLAMVLATVVGGVAVSSRASAADLSGQLTDLTVSTDRTSVLAGSFVTSTMGFCLPDGAEPGDTILITLPADIERWTKNFTITAPDGTVVGTGVTNQTASPNVATITLTDAYTTALRDVTNVCVNLAMSGYVVSTVTAGETLGLTYTIGNQSVSPTKPVPVVGTPTGTATTPTEMTKTGRFAVGGERCHNEADSAGCLAWDILVPLTTTNADGTTTAADTITITDAAQSSLWTWYCSAGGADTKSRIEVYTYPNDVTGTTANTEYLSATGVYGTETYPGLVTAVSCTPDNISVTLNTTVLDDTATTADERASMAIRLTWRATPTSVTAAKSTFTNTVTVTSDGTAVQKTATVANSAIGGVVAGDHLTVSKYDQTSGVAADTEADAEKLMTADGSATIAVDINNTGTTTLKDLTVTDADIATSSGTVSDFQCTFGDEVVAATAQADGSLVVTSPTGYTLARGGSLSCTAALTGVTSAAVHGDTVTVTATGNGKVSASNPFYAKVVPPTPTPADTPTVTTSATPSASPSATPTVTPGASASPTASESPSATPSATPSAPSPAVDIEKTDENGNDADTAKETVDLTKTNGTIGLDVPVTNTGSVDLTNIVITDELLAGSGRVTELTCDMTNYGGKVVTDDLSDGSIRIEGGRDVVLPVGKVIDCTAKLSGVTAVVHSDRMTVNADGIITGVDKNGNKTTRLIPVEDHDDYHAKTTVRPTPSTPATPTVPGKPGAPVNPGTPSSGHGTTTHSLAHTGTDSLAAIILAAGTLAGGALLVGSRRRKDA